MAVQKKKGAARRKAPEHGMKFRDYFPAALFIILACVALYFLLPAYTKYRETRGELQNLQETMTQQKRELRQLRKELTELRTDYRAIERVAREKFGLCREGETIYHFDQPNAMHPDTLKKNKK